MSRMPERQWGRATETWRDEGGVGVKTSHQGSSGHGLARHSGTCDWSFVEVRAFLRWLRQDAIIRSTEEEIIGETPQAPAAPRRNTGVPRSGVAEPGQGEKNHILWSVYRADVTGATLITVWQLLHQWFLRSGWKEIGGETLTLYTGTPLTNRPCLRLQRTQDRKRF